MNTQRTHKTARRLAAATAMLALSGLGTATLTTSASSASHSGVRAPGQISTSTPNACGYCQQHNEEAGRDDA